MLIVVTVTTRFFFLTRGCFTLTHYVCVRSFSMRGVRRESEGEKSICESWKSGQSKSRICLGHFFFCLFCWTVELEMKLQVLQEIQMVLRSLFRENESADKTKETVGWYVYVSRVTLVLKRNIPSCLLIHKGIKILAQLRKRDSTRDLNL